jgi:hypothetical protein
MDKHQRRHIAKWEAKKAKDLQKVEEERRWTSAQQTVNRIVQVVHEWEPSPNEVFAKARALLEDPMFLPLWDRFLGIERMLLFQHHYRLICSKRIQFFMNSREVAAQIAEEKSWKLESQVRQLAHTLARHQSRVGQIRKELLQQTTRLRAIQNCRLIKEELMMNVWHPRRVGYILETYGWEGYDACV